MQGMQLQGKKSIKYRYLVTLVVIGLFSCVSYVPYPSPPEKVERKIGGIVRVGRFVSPYSYEWFIRAEVLAARGDDRAAVGAYRRALAGPEEDPLVIARLAEAFDRLGDHKASEKALERAAQIDADSEAVWLARARSYEQLGKLRTAIAAYEHAQTAAPRSVEAPLSLVRLLNKSGYAEKARAVIERFAKRAPGSSAAAARSRLSLAVAEDDLANASEAIESLRFTEAPLAEEVRAVIRLAIKKGNFELASTLVELLPRSSESSNSRLFALFHALRFASTNSSPAGNAAKSFIALVEEVKAYLFGNHQEQAEKTTERVLKVGIKNDTIIAAADTSLSSGKLLEAADYYGRIAPGAPVYARARLGLAKSLNTSALPELAAEILAEAARSKPALPRDDKLKILETLAEIYIQRGALADALDVSTLIADAGDKSGARKIAAKIYPLLSEPPPRELVQTLSR